MRKNMRRLSMFLASVMLLSMLIMNVFAAPMFPFTDVKSDAWYYNDVKNAYEKKLINGKTQSTYGPNENMTYAEAVKLAACMHQLKKEGTVTLKNGNPWYQSYVDYAKKHNLITSDLAWNEKATRGGYMEIFANVLTDAESKKNNIPNGSIPDVALAHQNATAIYKLYRAGIVTGIDAKHNCDPDANIRRSEVAAILTRMMDKSKRVAFSMSTNTVADSGGSGGETPAPTPTPTPEPSTPSTPTSTLKVKTHPQNAEAASGDTIALTVEAEGGKEPYSYQWQILNTRSGEFVDLTGEDGQQGEQIYGKRANKLEVWLDEQAETANDYTLRCVVTDDDGNSVTSNAGFIKYMEIKIVKNPADAHNVKPSEYARFSVAAEGGKPPYTYLWQIKTSDGYENFNNIPKAELDKYFVGWKSADMSVKAASNEWVKDREFRCEVTDENGNWVYSNSAKLTVDELRITKHPRSAVAPMGPKVILSVEAEGGKGAYTYQWMVLRPEVNHYAPITAADGAEGFNTNEIKFKMERGAYLLGKNIRCKVKDETGTELFSEIAIITTILN